MLSRGVSWNGPARAPQPLAARPRVSAKAAPVGVAPAPSPQLLVQQLEELQSQHSAICSEDLARRLNDIEALGTELGVNRVVPELNNGRFYATPISGRLKEVTAASAPLTLGGLTFNAVHPNDLALAFRPLEGPPVFKGERDGNPQAYAITSAFTVVEHGLPGVCEMVGSYRLDPDNAQRLHVMFTDVVLSLAAQEAMDEAHRRAWLELFAPPNPEGIVDARMGRISVHLPNPSHAWLDFMVMVPGWQLMRSHFGSIALLREQSS